MRQQAMQIYLGNGFLGCENSRRGGRTWGQRGNVEPDHVEPWCHRKLGFYSGIILAVVFRVDSGGRTQGGKERHKWKDHLGACCSNSGKRGEDKVLCLNGGADLELIHSNRRERYRWADMIVKPCGSSLLINYIRQHEYRYWVVVCLTLVRTMVSQGKYTKAKQELG